MTQNYLKLCLVTHCDVRRADHQHFITEAIAGGVTSIQLRIKDISSTELYCIALAFKKLLDSFKSVKFILNDHVELAKEIDADGVHLGQTDMDPDKARTLLGPHKIIGLSIETLQELESANQLSCLNYVAASAVFPSQTKFNCKTIWGISGLKTIVNSSRHPVVAIGGINSVNICDVMRVGASGVAVVSAIHDQRDARQAACDLVHAVNDCIAYTTIASASSRASPFRSTTGQGF